MRRYIGLCGLLLSAAFLFSSCLKDDDDEVTLYDDTALTSFGISSAKALVHTTASTGEDSTYYATSDLSSYPFSIDHLKGMVYNADSLPYGTSVAKALVTYGTKNNGVACIENLAGDSVKYLSTSDSLDFSTPRKVRVYASNGDANYRTYTVTVNVHQQDGDAFAWSNPGTSTAIAPLTALHLSCLGDSLLLIGREAGGSVALYATALADGQTWRQSGEALVGGDFKGAAAKGDTLYVLCGATLKAKPQGEALRDMAQADGLEALLGATTTELYAYAVDGSIMVSRDGGRTWQADATEEDKALLPTEGLAFGSAAFAYGDSTDCALLAGSRSTEAYPGEAHAMVWRKLVEYGSTKEETAWSVVEYTDGSGYPLPRLESLAVLPYGSSFLAFGGKGMGGCTATAFDKVYESRDGGLTWKASAKHALPDGFDKAGATSFAATVDKSNHLWLVCGGTGQVWRGRLNRLSWQ